MVKVNSHGRNARERDAYIRELESDLETLRVFHDPESMWTEENVRATDEALARARARAGGK